MSIELVDGQSAEVCLALDGWIADAPQSLERGLLLLIDYGAPRRRSCTTPFGGRTARSARTSATGSTTTRTATSAART